MSINPYPTVLFSADTPLTDIQRSDTPKARLADELYGYAVANSNRFSKRQLKAFRLVEATL